MMPNSECFVDSKKMRIDRAFSKVRCIECVKYLMIATIIVYCNRTNWSSISHSISVCRDLTGKFV